MEGKEAIFIDLRIGLKASDEELLGVLKCRIIGGLQVEGTVLIQDKAKFWKRMTSC